MKRLVPVEAAALSILALVLSLSPARAQSKDDASKDKHDSEKPASLTPEQQASKGSVTISGKIIPYDAFAGTIIVHPKNWDDVPQNEDKDDKNLPPQASMFYAAYFKSGDASGQRPVTFFYNGGPGSSTVWLHMGAFGPKRVVTLDNSHTPAAPYPLVNNDFSLLDATDMVFVDAPGTGFSRIAGKDREKNFYGVDADAEAFADFISQFLAKYGRWNSPKYLFGESYGTPRSAVLINLLETGRAIDFNGVVLLSQCLNYDLGADTPQFNPGVDLPYEIALPTMAATAWYHHKLPNQPNELASFLTEVEHFALTDYAIALGMGNTLPDDRRKAIAERLHNYTGLSADYIEKSNLRINAGQFEKNLLGETDTTTGRLDTRFSGPTLDPLSREAEYDPQASAIASAYVSAFNDYVRKELKFGENREYKPEIDVEKNWNFLHQPPGAPIPLPQAVNTMVDLASAMKQNPDLKVMVNGGYFDLATPFFEGIYEMQHMQIPAKLQKNIEFKYYESGHMVYAHEASLKELHNSVAAFIQSTENTKGK
ncbi:MAG TPA: peptidase S10 [Candidatus Sulfotelmatobacter sp.]